MSVMDDYPTTHDIPVGALIVAKGPRTTKSGYKFRDSGIKNVIPIEYRLPDGTVKFDRVHLHYVIFIDPDPPAPFQHRHVWDEHAAKPWNKNVCGCPKQDHGPTEPEPGDPFTEVEPY